MPKYFYDRNDNKKIYNLYYLKYQIAKVIDINLDKNNNYNNIINNLNLVYGNSLRKVITLKYVESILKDNHQKEEVLALKLDVTRFINYYNYYKKLSKDKLLDLLLDYYHEYNSVSLETIAIVFNIYFSTYNNDELIEEYLNYLENDNIITIDKLLTNIHEDNYDITLKYYLDDNINYIFNKLNIIKVKDLINSSTTFISLLFYKDFPNIKKTLTNLEYSLEDNIFNNINYIYKVLNDREYNIISSRYGIINNKSMTLEDVGTLFKLTRERVRQIEAKAISKLVETSKSIEEYAYFLFYKLSNNKYYISSDELYNYFNDDIITRKILFLYSINATNITYDYKLEVVYDKHYINLDKIINETIKKLGKFINNNRYNNASNLEKCVIKNNYYLYKGNSYLLKGYKESEFILDIIDHYFIDGYKIENELYHNKLNNIMNKIIEENITIPSTRSIATYFERYNYTLINRGLYKNRKYTIKLPQELKNAIFKYIDNYDGNAIYYNELYEVFKSKLDNIGILNLYYFKGVIDYELPTDLISHRDYISINSTESGRETLVKLYRSFNNLFTIKDLLDAHPGIKEYTFYSVLASEEANGLLFLSNRSFIYYDKLNINNKTINSLKNHIISCFNLTKDNEISITYLYNHIFSHDQDLANKLDFMFETYNLYSLCKYLFKDLFGFDRPFIMKYINNKKTILCKVYDYIKNHDHITYNDILEYCDKLKINFNKPFIYISEDLSDIYIQDDYNSLIRKSILNLSCDIIKIIRNNINDYLNEYKFINTKKYNDLVLPIIKIKWNKYLLIGILRSYFNDYNIVKIDKFNNNSDYLITYKK